MFRTPEQEPAAPNSHTSNTAASKNRTTEIPEGTDKASNLQLLKKDYGRLDGKVPVCGLSEGSLCLSGEASLIPDTTRLMGDRQSFLSQHSPNVTSEEEQRYTGSPWTQLGSLRRN